MTELKGNYIDLSWKPDGQPGGPVFLMPGKPLKLSGSNWPFPFRFNNIDSSSRSDTSGPSGGGGRPPEGGGEGKAPPDNADAPSIFAAVQETLGRTANGHRITPCLWDETLLIWGGEFGRTPTSEGVGKPGRDHYWYGLTRCHVSDLHATILSLMASTTPS